MKIGNIRYLIYNQYFRCWILSGNVNQKVYIDIFMYFYPLIFLGADFHGHTNFSGYYHV